MHKSELLSSDLCIFYVKNPPYLCTQQSPLKIFGGCQEALDSIFYQNQTCKVMKRLLLITFLFAASLSCNKEEVANIDLPTAFTTSEAQNWFENYTKNKKQARIVKKETLIFGEDYNPVWELAYEEIHENGSKTIYAPFDNGTSSATPIIGKLNDGEQREKQLKDDLIYPKLNRIAVTKEIDGSVTFRLVQYVSFEKVSKFL
jgi:hypothetical protein